ncbi:MAG: histidinol dehydrogenase [Desulfobacteraceae bacterium]|nr:histidinol dehydrogenase [Desulfobacteraceae bacterium]
MEILTYPSAGAEKRIGKILDRALDYAVSDYEKVSAIVEDVQTRGDDALIEYTRRFDAPEMRPDLIRATDEEIEKASSSVKSEFLTALNRAASQIEAFHRRQVRNSWISTDRQGVVLGQLVNPVDAAGIYVPGAKGGTTPLVSSVLMGAIPAAIAGVSRLVMVTPPMEDCSVNPHLLAAARAAGISEVYKVGGAWAIAALAYGTQIIPSVDVIAGPGNIYVALAKKIVSGKVGIDMIAGPSEILVIADETADPACIAADLLSQAEHDVLSSAVLISVSHALAEKVRKELESQLSNLTRREIAQSSLAEYGGVFTVPDMETALALANRIAPEHLELQVEDPFAWLSLVRNAGAVFLGGYSPEPVGDYVAGPNHVLPTGGTARFSSALSVDCFVKQTSVVYYSKEAFLNESADIIRLAETEGLSAHAESVKKRLLKS